MGKAAKAMPQAVPVLLAALVLMSCLATSSSSRIPRRLLMVAGSRTALCNDDVINWPTPRGGCGGGSDGVKAESRGSRIPLGPPPPKGGVGRARAAGITPPPGNNI